MVERSSWKKPPKLSFLVIHFYIFRRLMIKASSQQTSLISAVRHFLKKSYLIQFTFKKAVSTAEDSFLDFKLISMILRRARE